MRSERIAIKHQHMQNLTGVVEFMHQQDCEDEFLTTGVAIDCEVCMNAGANGNRKRKAAAPPAEDPAAVAAEPEAASAEEAAATGAAFYPALVA